MEFATTPDGAKLRMGHWPAPRDDGPGRVLLLQGRTEFIEKYVEVIDELGARGFEVWALDWRGQGQSDRLLQNRHKGHIDRFQDVPDDLHWFTNAVVPSTGKLRTVVLAHSMGGHIAMRAMLEGRLRPERAVLSAPMFDLPLTGTKRISARLLAAACRLSGRDGKRMPGMGDYETDERPFEGNPLTGDRTRFDRMRAAVAANTDLALGRATLGWSRQGLQSNQCAGAPLPGGAQYLSYSRLLRTVGPRGLDPRPPPNGGAAQAMYLSWLRGRASRNSDRDRPDSQRILGGVRQIRERPRALAQGLASLRDEAPVAVMDALGQTHRRPSIKGLDRLAGTQRRFSRRLEEAPAPPGNWPEFSDSGTTGTLIGDTSRRSRPSALRFRPDQTACRQER